MIKGKLCTALFLTLVCFGLIGTAQSDEASVDDINAADIKAKQQRVAVYNIYSDLSDLVGGDLIRINSYGSYLTCSHIAPKKVGYKENLTTYLWKVAVSDQNNDGIKEYRFEGFSVGGPTGKYLAAVDIGIPGVKQLLCVSQNEIPAPWQRHEYWVQHSQSVMGYGYPYRKRGVSIKNYHPQQGCLELRDGFFNVVPCIESDNAYNRPGLFFTFEVLVPSG